MWQIPEAIEIPDTSEDETITRFDPVVSSIAHKCADCHAHHFIPQNPPPKEAETETISTSYLFPEAEAEAGASAEAEAKADIFDADTVAASDIQEITEESAAQDPLEQAFVDVENIMELVDGEDNFAFVAPDIVLLEEIIKVNDSEAVDSETEDKQEEEDDEDLAAEAADAAELLFTYEQLFYPKNPWYKTN